MIKKQVFIGFIVGLLANVIGLYFSAMLLGGNDNFTDLLKSSLSEGFLGKLISLGAVLNLIAFFIFIQKKQDYRARGVLFATVTVAIITFILNFY